MLRCTTTADDDNGTRFERTHARCWLPACPLHLRPSRSSIPLLRLFPSLSPLACPQRHPQPHLTRPVGAPRPRPCAHASPCRAVPCAALDATQGPGGTAPSPASLQASKAQQRSGNPIPVILAATSTATDQASLAAALSVPGVADGVAVTLGLLPSLAAACGAGAQLPPGASVADLTATVLDRLTNGSSGSSSSGRPVGPAPEPAAATPKAAPGPHAAAAQAGIPREDGTGADEEGNAGPGPGPGSSAAGPGSAREAALLSSSSGAAVVSPSAPSISGRPLWRLLDAQRELLLSEEKAALTEVLDFLTEVRPDMNLNSCL